MKKKTKWKIEDAFGHSIRKVDDYYCLTDLSKCVKSSFRRFDPWKWAQSEGITIDISRRGWIFKTCWAKEKTLVKFAKYMSPGLYNGVLKSLGILDAYGLIEYFGEDFAARIDERAATIVKRRHADKILQEQRQELAEDNRREVRRLREAQDIQREARSAQPTRDPRAQKIQRNREQARSAPTSRSMSPSRGDSITHHRSEPDYLTQALVMQAILDTPSTPSHSSHSSRSDDTCYTPSYSSHSSSDSHHSSSSWSGDSGGSYDSGGGGCGD